VEDRDEFVSKIDEALTENFVECVSQIKTTIPVMISDLASPPSHPDQIPASEPLAMIFPLVSDNILIKERP
jgi:hypothetical protein